MSRTTIKSYVETKCAAISGVRRVLSGRLKGGKYVPTGFPLMIVELGTAYPPVGGTFMAGGNGKQRYPYDLNITLLLDRKDAEYQKVQSDALVYFDRVRAAFSNDYKLGGNAWDSTLGEPMQNLDVFKEPGVDQYPQIAWKLRVIEERAYNAAAS